MKADEWGPLSATGCLKRGGFARNSAEGPQGSDSRLSGCKRTVQGTPPVSDSEAEAVYLNVGPLAATH